MEFTPNQYSPSEGSYGSFGGLTAAEGLPPATSSGPLFLDSPTFGINPGGAGLIPCVEDINVNWPQMNGSRAPGVDPESLSGDTPAPPYSESGRVAAVTKLIEELEQAADKDHFNDFTKQLEKLVRVNLLSDQDGLIIDQRERQILSGYIINPGCVNERLFKGQCSSPEMGAGSLEAFNQLVTSAHQVSAVLKHIAPYVQSCLEPDKQPKIPDEATLLRILLFIRLVVPTVNGLRESTAVVEGWEPNPGFFDHE